MAKSNLSLCFDSSTTAEKMATYTGLESGGTLPSMIILRLASPLQGSDTHKCSNCLMFCSVGAIAFFFCSLAVCCTCGCRLFLTYSYCAEPSTGLIATSLRNYARNYCDGRSSESLLDAMLVTAFMKSCCTFGSTGGFTPSSMAYSALSCSWTESSLLMIFCSKLWDGSYGESFLMGEVV